MRVEFLFFRWLAVIAVVALGLVYAGSSHQRQPRSSYETIPLIQGGRSSGMQLAGIAVDSNRRDVYAIVGASGNDTPHEFYIVWKGKSGETYGTTFPLGNAAPEALFQVSPEGQVRTLQTLSPESAGQGSSEKDLTASRESTLRSAIEALSPRGGL